MYVHIYIYIYIYIHIYKSFQFKILNLIKFVLSLDLDAFINENTILPYHSSNSCFEDRDHGHILTEDFRIIYKNKLRKPFAKRKNI